jgi:ABC-type glycerol-3-phosphate transport system substrate-binding protein
MEPLVGAVSAAEETGAVRESGAAKGAGITRRRVALGAASVAALAAAACGPVGAPEGSGSTGSTQPVTLQWQVRGGPTYNQLAQWAVGEFKKKYPNATVETSADNTGHCE